MIQTLESTGEIRRALGEEACRLIEEFDVLHQERGRTDLERRKLLSKYPSSCATCAICPSGSRGRLEAAHLLSLEEGGRTTEDNLVLLCSECHQLYDRGYASLKEMTEEARLWRSGSIRPIKVVMLARKTQMEQKHGVMRPLADPRGLLKKRDFYVLIQARNWRKALETIASMDGLLSEADRQVMMIVEAQVQRRRAAHGALESAKRVLDRIHVNQLPPERVPLYFYELGCVHQLMGLPEEAGRSFRKSMRSAAGLHRDRYSALEALIAEAQWLAMEVIQSPVAQPSTAGTIGSIATQLDKAARRADMLGGTWGGRLRLSCKAWAARLLLKSGDLGGARKALGELGELRGMQDVTTGWTVLARSLIGPLQGLVLLASPTDVEEARDGLCLIARGLVSYLKAYRERPEGIRDMLVGFEKGLRLLPRQGQRDAEGLVERIGKVRTRIRDGSSVLDPYRLAT